MSLFNTTQLQQGLILAGSLSLYSGLAQAQSAPTDVPQGRAGTATLCIEKRSYVDVDSKRIVTPVIYLNEISAEGINTGYVPGNQVAQEWDKLLKTTDPKRKEWLKEAEDLPNQFNDAVDLVMKFDKNKDGIVSKEEFEKGERGASESTKRTDLGLLMALACSGKYLTEGALNTINLDDFPEVVTLKEELDAANQKLDKAESAVKVASKDIERFTRTTQALGGALVLTLGLAIIFGRKARKSKAADGAPKAPKTPADPVEPAKIKLIKPAKAEPEAPAANYNDVLKELEPEAPNKDVLAALQEPEQTPVEDKTPEPTP